MKRFLYVALLTGVLLNPSLFAENKDEDEKAAYLTYHAGASVEVDIEYGETYLTFNVACRKDSKEARDIVAKESEKWWAQIVKEVPLQNQTEISRNYWNDLVVQKYKAIEEVKETDKTTGLLLTKWFNPCNSPKTPLSGPQAAPTMWQASHRIGVRTTKLDWIEALVRAAKNVKQEDKLSSLKLSVNDIKYDISAAKSLQVRQSLVDKAKEIATGKGSHFENDVKNLRLETAHYLGYQKSYAPTCTPSVISAVNKEGVPVAYVQMPFTCSVYGKAKEVLKKQEEQRGVLTQVEVLGSATLPVDFGEITVQISSECQSSENMAVQTVEQVAEKLVSQLRDFHKTTANSVRSETNQFNNNEIGSVSGHVALEGIIFKKDPNTNVLKPITYYNRCRGTVVSAEEAKDKDKDKFTYYGTSRSLSLRSSNYNALRSFAQKLQAENQKDGAITDAKVSVSEIRVDVTTATKQKMAQMARLEATSCLLKDGEQLSKEMSMHGFTFACLKDVRPSQTLLLPVPATRSATRFGSSGLEAAADMSPETGPKITVVEKPQGERKTLRFEETYGFKFRVSSADYTKIVK